MARGMKLRATKAAWKMTWRAVLTEQHMLDGRRVHQGLQEAADNEALEHEVARVDHHTDNLGQYQQSSKEQAALQFVAFVRYFGGAG